MNISDKIDQLVIERAGSLPNWKPYYYQSMDSGLMVKGCATTIFKRGPRKGQTKFLTKENSKTILISEGDLARLMEGQS